MEKLEMLYEGKAKKVFKTDDEKLLIVDYKDDATAFNGLKKGQIMGKGVINNKMTNIVLQYLADNGIETHFVKELSDRETLVKRVSIVPLEVIIRNVAAGSFSKKFGVAEGTPLNNPILEFSYKNDELGDPMINELQALAIGIATKEEIDSISEQALKVNELLKKFFLNVGIKLIDFKIEFGRYGKKAPAISVGAYGYGYQRGLILVAVHVLYVNSVLHRLAPVSYTHLRSDPLERGERTSGGPPDEIHTEPGDGSRAHRK